MKLFKKSTEHGTISVLKFCVEHNISITDFTNALKSIKNKLTTNKKYNLVLELSKNFPVNIAKLQIFILSYCKEMEMKITKINGMWPWDNTLSSFSTKMLESLISSAEHYETL